MVKDYTGPGSYVTGGFSSSFSGVGLDTSKLEKAEEEGDAKKDDAEVTKDVTKALTGSSVALMSGAKVEITAADEVFIDGTAQWAGAIGLNGPTSISGQFHARIRKKRTRK